MTENISHFPDKSLILGGKTTFSGVKVLFRFDSHHQHTRAFVCDSPCTREPAGSHFKNFHTFIRNTFSI